MKKYLSIISIISLTLILSSCLTNTQDVEDAKKELGIIEMENNEADLESQIQDAKSNMDNEEKEEIEVEIPETKKVEINYLTSDKFLELDDLSNENLLDGEVEITGKTLTSVDKIIVKFQNASSDFPDDEYELKQFTAGDDTFLYRAFSRYETLDFGKNVYILEAYSGDKISQLELVLNVFEEEEKTLEEKQEKVYEDISLDSLPVNSTYGTPVDLGNGKIAYSDIKGLEIKTDIISDLTCENLTSVLADKVNTWFFWNTCRPIETDEGLSYFVVRLDGDEYVYEKHYYLSYEGIYITQELETGTGVDSKNIGEKNEQLKEKNEDFVILDITDELVKEILK